MNGQTAQAIERGADTVPLTIGFKRLSEYASLPTKAHASDSGFDLYTAQDVIIAPGETVVVPTDIAVQLPQGYEATVRPRSGITSKTKLRVQLGTIDEQYRGNIGIIVDNIFRHGRMPNKRIYGIDNRPIGYASEYHADDASYLIRKGDKIAQLVVQPIPAAVAVEITGELEETERGTNAYGSSGVR